MTTVAIDAMGGDHAPSAVVQGTLRAARDASLNLVLVGRSEEIGPLIAERSANLRIEEAPDAMAMSEQPTLVRQRPNSSIMVGLDLVRRGEADAFVSFGNTGAVMAASLLRLGRIPGVARPALGTLFGNERGTQTLLLDVGANAEVRPLHLVQFAAMGKAYFEQVQRHRNPSIGLLNIGEEREKGSPLLQEAYVLLEREEPNFIGNVEGSKLVSGIADVVVADGISGNLAVKVSESITELVIKQLRRAISTRLYYALGAWLLRGAFDRMREQLDYQRVGGAPLFGVNGAVVIGHGASKGDSVAGAIDTARRYVELDLVEGMRAELSALLSETPSGD